MGCFLWVALSLPRTRPLELSELGDTITLGGGIGKGLGGVKGVGEGGASTPQSFICSARAWTGLLGLRFQSSDHILVWVGFPMARLGKRAKPCYREGVSENRLQVHPLSFFSPSSLFLFQLLYALKNERQPQLQCGPDKLGIIKYYHVLCVDVLR